MKKTAILLFVLFCVASLRAQGRKMYIDLNNGKRITFDTGTIAKITFTPPVLPKYDAMNVFTRYIIPSPDVHYTTNIDSIIFVDTSIGEYIAIYDSTREIAPGISTAYPIDRPHGVDSITFSEFQTDTNVTLFANTVYYWDSNWTGRYRVRTIGNFPVAVWAGSRIYSVDDLYGFLRVYSLDSSNEVIGDSIMQRDTQPNVFYLRANGSGTKLLFVKSLDGNFFFGSLMEHDIASDSYAPVIGTDDTNISSAVYWGADSILYYSYGSYSSANPNPPDAGYYLLDRKAATKTFLFQYISDFGPMELVNGFDVSPDRSTLLIPIVREGLSPLVAEYHFATHRMDTLGLHFSNVGYERWNLWLRYNHDASKILYCNYSVAVAGTPVSDTSEIGIIDRNTLDKQVLGTAVDNESGYVNVFPEWSPDEKAIVYGSSIISREPPGYLNNFQVCILKSLR